MVTVDDVVDGREDVVQTEDVAVVGVGSGVAATKAKSMLFGWDRRRAEDA